MVLQDFHAANLTAALVLAGGARLKRCRGEKTSGHQGRAYQINFAQAFAKMKQFGGELWRLADKAMRQRLMQLADLLACYLEQVRPDRKAPRKMTKFNKKLHHMAYKSTL